MNTLSICSIPSASADWALGTWPKSDHSQKYCQDHDREARCECDVYHVFLLPFRLGGVQVSATVSKLRSKADSCPDSNSRYPVWSNVRSEEWRLFDTAFGRGHASALLAPEFDCPRDGRFFRKTSGNILPGLSQEFRNQVRIVRALVDEHIGHDLVWRRWLLNRMPFCAITL